MNIVQLYRGKDKKWYLRLVAKANGQRLAQSEGYYSKFNAKRAARKNFSGIELEIIDEGGQ